MKQHIPIEEMLEDLRITNKEIQQFEEEINILKKDYKRNKLAIYFNEGRIIQRRSFVEKLEQLIKQSNETN